MHNAHESTVEFNGSQTYHVCVSQFHFVYIFLIWKDWMAPMEGHKRTPCYLISSSLAKILMIFLLLWSLLNINWSHFLQQVQLATRLNQIMISICSNLAMYFFCLIGFPLYVAFVVDFSKIHVITKEEESKLLPPKTHKKLWQITWKCQNVWATQFPWAKMLKNETGKVHHVKCLICSWGMLFGECVDINVSKWTLTGEHDQIFFGIFCWCQKNIKRILKVFFWHMAKNISWRGRIFCYLYMDECYLWIKNINGWKK